MLCSPRTRHRAPAIPGTNRKVRIGAVLAHHQSDRDHHPVSSETKINIAPIMMTLEGLEDSPSLYVVTI
jgi:hypothetical protein